MTTLVSSPNATLKKTAATAAGASQPVRVFWLALASASVAIIVAAAIRWSFAHPYGIHWDEAGYLNEVAIDVQRLRGGMLLRLAGRLLVKSGGRPPAYRILALPVLGVFGFHVTTARFLSLACFGLASWFVFAGTRRVGSQLAAAFAVFVFVLSPEVVSASMFFGTDSSLYLATSAMLYFLFRHWNDSRPGIWLGLGSAIGFGLWTKASFAAILLPVLFVAVAIDYGRHRSAKALWPLGKAVSLGVALAAPWWLLNIRSALAYAKYSRDFVRISLGSPSIATTLRWLSTVMQGLFGVCVSFLLACVLARFIIRAIRKEVHLEFVHKAALSTCLCAGAPIMMLQLSGTNHLLRHISPAVIPVAIGIGILADCAEIFHSRVFVVSASVLFCAQLAMIVAPVFRPNRDVVSIGLPNGSLPWRVMVRFDQWDWRPLLNIADNCGLESPKIAYLGDGRNMDPPAMQYPWIARAAFTRVAQFDVADPNWLWRLEDGPLNWKKVMDQADQADIVLTAPQFVGEAIDKEDLDNQYNSEFDRRLMRDPYFRGPIIFSTGRFKPVEVDVFVKKALVCHQ